MAFKFKGVDFIGFDSLLSDDEPPLPEAVARSLFALAVMTPAKPSKRELKEIREQARTYIAGGLS